MLQQKLPNFVALIEIFLYSLNFPFSLQSKYILIGENFHIHESFSHCSISFTHLILDEISL